MRVVGGTRRGRTYELGGFSGRPTMDRAREALLNIMSNRRDLSQCAVLDLYAGTGAVGIEFASWGAAHVTCVEASPRHVALIKRHVERFDLPNVRVVRGDALRFASQSSSPYAIVFADPPYAAAGLPSLIPTLLASPALAPGGIVIVEHPAALRMEAPPGAERRLYGQSAFTLVELGQ